MKKLNKIILNIIQTYLLGGFVSNLLLSFLILTDSYFYNLNFPEENFHIKIVKYFTYTVYVPILLMVLFVLLKITRVSLITKKIIMGFSGILGVVIFIGIDKVVKKLTIFSEHVLLSVVILTLVYGGFFFLVYKKNKVFCED